jgi:hypothetical protein
MSPREDIDNHFVGAALVTNTTACEASRALLSPGSRRFDVMEGGLRIYDLLSLIDSVVLHERVCCLPASLPHDVSDLELRNQLVSSGVLTTLPASDDQNLIGRALLASLSTVEGHHLHDGASSRDRTPIAFESYQRVLASVLGPEAAMDSEKDGRYGRREAYQGYSVASRADSFDDAARSLIDWMKAGPSGSYEDGLASFRAMYYVFAGEHWGLPYLASAMFVKIQRSFPNYVQPAVRERLYQNLSAALRTTIDVVAQEFDGPLIFIPPFSALVLDRAASPAEIPAATLNLRAEYDDFRRKMLELEREHMEAKSLNDRLTVVRRMEQLGKEVVRPFDQPSHMKLEPALRYIPDAVDLVANPTNPAKWMSTLLGLPAEALLSWYRRRPVAKLVRTAQAVGALPDYGNLLTKHFGEEMAMRTMQLQQMNEDS